jgi:hypothetical protein
VIDGFSVDQKIEWLEDTLHRASEKDVMDAVWSLTGAANDWEIADRVIERLLAILTNEEMYQSPLAGYLLQFFEVESIHLTDRQKWLCIRFLNEQGDRFKDGFSSLMVGELRSGLYLKMKSPILNSGMTIRKCKRDCTKTRDGHSRSKRFITI